MPIYLFVNIRRFLCEQKINKIKNNDLLENGFIQFESENGKKLFKYLDEIIKNPENAEKSNLGNFKIIKKDSFGVKTIAVDASSEFLHKYVFTDEILNKLNDYYGKEFYLRNNPTIEFSYDTEVNDAQLFHLDYCAKQTSVMINLNDITDTSTHMEYLKKSNKKYRFIIPMRENPKEINKVEKISKHCETARTTGSVGRISIFDAGCGYHRQVGGGRRVMLHLNFTENLAYTGWKKNWNPPDHDYWFSKNNNNLQDKLFNLVNKKYKASFLTPKIYSEN